MLTRFEEFLSLNGYVLTETQRRLAYIILLSREYEQMGGLGAGKSFLFDLLEKFSKYPQKL